MIPYQVLTSATGEDNNSHLQRKQYKLNAIIYNKFSSQLNEDN